MTAQSLIDSIFHLKQPTTVLWAQWAVDSAMLINRNGTFASYYKTANTKAWRMTARRVLGFVQEKMSETIHVSLSEAFYNPAKIIGLYTRDDSDSYSAAPIRTTFLVPKEEADRIQRYALPPHEIHP